MSQPRVLTDASAGAPAHRARRVLVTGLSTYWGGRLAAALEAFPDIEAIIGVDSRDPTRELERTEFVRVGHDHSLIARIVRAAEIDTVIDTRLIVDAIVAAPRNAHENNVIGTMNILAACTGTDSPVRKFVFKSSAHYYGCEQDDPAFFTEEMRRPHPPRSPIERDIVEAETAVAEFAEQRPDVAVTVLRFANVLGPGIVTSHSRMFALPLVPMILGFDPRYQFVHEDDVVHALEHAAMDHVPGTYNVAADGVLSLSEVIGLLGKRPLPLLPPWGTGLVASPLRRFGFRIPNEMLNQLRFGRGLDNRRYKAAGFHYNYTSRETVLRFGEHLRLSPVLRGVEEPYRYERDVEEFLRWSPHVRRENGEAGREEVASDAAGGAEAVSPVPSSRRRAAAPAAPGGLDPAGLESEEVIALLGTLDDAELEQLERAERDGRRRDTVLDAIDSVRAYGNGSG